jgi:hypothetical protein
MLYAYTSRDLLADEPFHYNYSPFEGAEFIDSYISSRLDACARLSMFSPEPSLVQANSAKFPEPGDAFRTEELLRDLVSVLWKSQLPSGITGEWARYFARKFEITKRLRAAYSSSGKMADPAYVSRGAYARLSFVLSSAVEAHDLRMLNALLKVNDLVLSGDIESGTEALVVTSVRRELAAVSGLSGRLGLSLKCV